MVIVIAVESVIRMFMWTWVTAKSKRLGSSIMPNLYYLGLTNMLDPSNLDLKYLSDTCRTQGLGAWVRLAGLNCCESDMVTRPRHYGSGLVFRPKRLGLAKAL
jgi:hypothetical protein